MFYIEDFENRVIYNEGEYFVKLNDDEVNNLIILLDLNN